MIVYYYNSLELVPVCDILCIKQKKEKNCDMDIWSKYLFKYIQHSITHDCCCRFQGCVCVCFAGNQAKADI